MACAACNDAGSPKESVSGEKPQGEVLTLELEGDAPAIRVYVAKPSASGGGGGSDKDEAKNGGGGKAKGFIVLAGDIFGAFGKFEQSKLFCDRLASAGFGVVMPDFFRGKPWPKDKFPLTDETKPAFFEWWGTVASDKVVRRDVPGIVAFARKTFGADIKAGFLGFCWGGLMSMSVAAAKPFSDTFAACGSIHGAQLTAEIAEKFEVPVMVLPAGDDPSYEPLEEVTKAKKFGKQCVYKAFKDEKHGFCAARGDLANPKAVEEAKKITCDFFTANLK